MLNILLAEDSLGDIFLVRRALETYHIPHALQIVRDGGEALDYVARMGQTGTEPCPDIMLLDLNLPKADGPQILREFRSHPQCTATPVIVMTSSDAPKDRARMAELGITHYFRKPSDLDAFLRLGALVRDAVERNGV